MIGKRKTWIKVKRGILEPKHIEKLGAAWYLYFYVLDNADWETGCIPEWKDDYAAQDLEKPLGMIREHRKHLADEGYITCIKKRYCQQIIIHNWTDPRRYDGVEQNPKQQSAEKPEVCDDESEDISEVYDDTLNNQSSGESSSQSTCQSSSQTILNPSVNRASFIKPHNHISTESQLTTTTAERNLFDVYEQEIGTLTAFIAEDLKDLSATYTDGWIIDAIRVASRANARNLGYVTAILKRWKTEGKDAGKRKTRAEPAGTSGNDAILEEVINGKF